MRSGSSVSRRGVLLITIMSPLLLGSYFKCVAVSNPAAVSTPSVTTARIEQIEPITPRVGDIIRVVGSGSGTPPLQFGWDFGDGTLAGGVQATHVYMAPGSYRITLTVRDATGNTASDSLQVAVSARVSSSEFSAALATDAVAGQPVLFAALPLKGNAGALSYAWTFSDGQSVVGPWATATFQEAGTYLASVTVTNALGTIAVAQIAFEVVDAEIERAL